MRRLLVVEDAEADFEAVARALRVYDDLTLARAASASEATRRLAEGPPPQLILVDLGLPGGDGRGLLVALRRDPRTAAVPVVVLSASGDPARVRECYALGAAGYLQKTIDGDAFRRRLRALYEYWFACALLPS